MSNELTAEGSPNAGGDRPLLSVCIPTYNGARRIESALYALAPQIAELEGAAELVVSDNCSTDDTREVVERARRRSAVYDMVTNGVPVTMEVHAG